MIPALSPCGHCPPDHLCIVMVGMAFFAGALWMLGWAPWEER